ncbi:MAG: helix-turn-helix domain-containing protein [Bacteroidota bacterium]|nr:helix-turn-helix domain-containing protein [Bacteroidota bacterium]MDP4217183.1 helix-turn-helix domain-containing protein [Bacteroidota bacterium]MDP4245402.1 helix-turn-helix domain-containing protein [Bacteroidota bacterium]MDP4259624.1 helix-turn-helix domain-containing protein [Bacteroidota bacterium]
MKERFLDKATRGLFSISIGDPAFRGRGIMERGHETINTIVYNTAGPQEAVIDNIKYKMPANSVVPLMANQHFVFREPENLVAWQFNRDFYCIADHDAEVGCVGFLFYGIEHPLFIPLSEEDRKSISTLERQCLEEMEIADKMQGEMLRTILKRLIIKITRLAKSQTENYRRFSEDKMDLVRKFSLLLEANFRSQHEVQFYAHALNKSPKTLTNLFHLYQYPSPSKLIQRRIILEAKRYLYYTDKSAKEVAADLGFTSAAHFSRFFKAGAGVNFSEFAEAAPVDAAPAEVEGPVAAMA